MNSKKSNRGDEVKNRLSADLTQTDIATPVRSMHRRQFLKTGAVVAGTALMAGGLGPIAARAASTKNNLPPNTPEWMLKQGHPIVTPPYGVPSKYESDVIRRPTDLTPTDISSWSFTPLQDLHGIVTPNGLVYERHHAGVPAIDPAEHRLMIHGMVDNPKIFTVEDLKRFPAVSHFYFLECSGNTLTEWVKPKGKTVQSTHGLLSCCEWTGVPLSTVLQEVGLKHGASWLLAEGADAAALDRSVPISKALDDAILVYAQNGEALRPEQGYPLRLLLPGFEGNMSVKWLRRIEVGDKPFMSHEETAKYTDLMPDGKARILTFVMEAKSVITSPSGGHRLHDKGFHEIRGLAWSGSGRISRVDVSVDGGRNWRRAELQGPVLPKCLTRFRIPWEWRGKEAILQSRTMDDTGYVQPTLKQLVAVRGTHSVYHYNAIQSWHVAADGEVTNVHA